MPRAEVAAATAAAVTTLLVFGWIGAKLSLGPVDDAYISLRYATHWAGGQGLVFNPGERVEGYTNFLWVALEAAAVRAGIDGETAMRALGAASLFALAFVFTLTLARFALPDRPRIVAVLGVLACIHPALLCWSASGLETCLYAALLLACLALALVPGRELSAGLALALAAGTRPEGAALLPVAVFAAARMGGARAALRLASLFLAVFGLYFALRAWHFGALLPNTFYAKLDFGSGDLLVRGTRYAWGFAAAVPPLFLTAGVALARRRRPAAIDAFALATAALLAIAIYEGGDHLAMFRFGVPALPFLGVLAVAGCVRLSAPAPERFRAAVASATAVLVVLGSGFTTLWARKADEHRRPLQLERFVGEVRMARNWSEMGRWLAAQAPPDATLATIAIGAIGYHSGLAIIDPHGLVDPVIAHREVDLGRGTAAHEKFDVDYVLLERRPSYLLIENHPHPRPVAAGLLPRLVWGDFNRALLARPELAERYALHAIPLDIGYMMLHVRRDLPAPGSQTSTVRYGRRE